MTEPADTTRRPSTVVERLRASQTGDACPITPTALSDSSGAIRILPREDPGDDALDRYAVDGLLGEGGMARVLCVRDADLGRALAAKVLGPEADAWAIGKFVREAQITGQLQHPNIPPVHDLGLAEDGRLYFTMKRVEGRDLANLLDLIDAAHETAQLAPSGPSRVELLRIFLKVCDGVAYAHSRGVIHRDLKPANVMVGRFGEVLVMDWGLARANWLEDATGNTTTAGVAVAAGPLARELDALATRIGGDDPDALLTRSGEIVGTPAYMPPEQAAGRSAQIDPRSDVYSLGAILYELLTLSPPFDGEDGDAVIDAVLAGDLESPAERAPDLDVPWELEAVVVKAMAYRRGQRYDSVEALAADVQRYLEGQTLAAADYRLWQRALKWTRRHRLPALAALLAGALMIGVVGWGWGRWTRASTARELARRARSEHAAGRWTHALVDCERALALRSDPALSALAADCRTRLEAEAADVARRVEEAASERQLADTLRPIAATLERAQTVLYARDVDIRPPLQAVRGVLRVLEDLAREPYSGRRPALWRLLGRGRELLGQTAAAEGALQRAAALDPGDASTQLALGRLAVQRTLELSIGSGPGRSARIAAARQRAARHLARVRSRAGALEQHLLSVYLAFAAGDRQAVGRLCREGLERFGEQLGAEALLVMLGWVSSPAEQLALWSQALERRPHYAWLYVCRGNLRIVMEDLAGAVRDFDRALAIAPDNAACWGDRGVARLLLGQSEAALADLQRAIALEPDRAHVHSNLGACLGRLGRHDEAAAAFERAIALDPGLAEAYCARAELALTQRRFDAALADLDRSIALEPTARALQLRGATRRVSRDLDGAAADIQRALELNPRFALAFAERGSLHHLRGNAAASRRDYDRALALDATLLNALNGRGLLSLAEGDLAAALADFEAGLRVKPGDVRLLTNRGEALFCLGRMEPALADWNRAIALAPQLAPAWSNRGKLRFGRGDHAGAAADYAKALALDPEHAGTYLNRGLLRRRAGQTAAALADYARAIELDPGLLQAYVNRAAIHAEAGRHDPALADLTQALARNTDYLPARLLRASVLRQLGRHAEALADWRWLIARRPERADLYRYRGQALEQLERYAEAAADFEQATRLAAGDWRHWAGLGRIRWRLGDPAAAATLYRKAAPLAPPAQRAKLLEAAAELEGAGG